MSFYESTEEMQEVIIGAFDKHTGRGDFLRKLLVAGAGTAAAGVALSAGALPALAADLTPGHTRLGVPKSDIDILNYALTLEHIEATFYRTTKRPMNAQIARYVNYIAQDEAAHVTALTAVIKQLGGMPVKEGMYKFPPLSLPFGITVENLGVHAYLGAAPLIKTSSILLTAASIVTVEARHAGVWTALNNNARPSLGAFDSGLPKADVVKAVTPFFVNGM